MAHLVHEATLRRFCQVILERGGLRPQDAALVTDVLLFADLRGIGSHGISRLPFYLKRLEAGGTDPHIGPSVVSESAASALLDARNGLGHRACAEAVDLATAKASEAGVAFVGVRGSSHNGALSYYAVRMAAREQVGFVFTNTTPLMAAWGGAGRAIGTNPLAFAAPRGDGPPFVFDAAMSRVAAGRVRKAADHAEKIPPGWIVDREGRETDDPRAFAEGALLPFGEHKGYGLALVVEVVAAVLTGAGMLHQNPFWQEAVDEPLSIGHAFIAIDVQRFVGIRAFEERMAWLAASLAATSPAAGSSGVIMPGDLEAECERERKEKGIPIDDLLWQTLEALSGQYEVASLAEATP